MVSVEVKRVWSLKAITTLIFEPTLLSRIWSLHVHPKPVSWPAFECWSGLQPDLIKIVVTFYGIDVFADIKYFTSLWDSNYDKDGGGDWVIRYSKLQVSAEVLQHCSYVMNALLSMPRCPLILFMTLGLRNQINQTCYYCGASVVTAQTFTVCIVCERIICAECLQKAQIKMKSFNECCQKQELMSFAPEKEHTLNAEPFIKLVRDFAHILPFDLDLQSWANIHLNPHYIF